MEQTHKYFYDFPIKLKCNFESSNTSKIFLLENIFFLKKLKEKTTLAGLKNNFKTLLKKDFIPLI